MSEGVVAERAHAKLNVGLAVLARRGDGFHEIETLMLRLALHDEVSVRPAAEGVHLVASGLEMPTGEGNLAVAAARAYLDAAGSSDGVEVRLVKRIPLAAGLGGGSSDAAAVLRALARLRPAAAADLPALAARLGSDVPFFLADVPAAVARGRGERVQPLTEELPRLPVVLVNPNVPVSAADAYARLQSFTPRLRVERVLVRLRAGQDAGAVNGLQPGVLAAHPEVREVLAALRAAGLASVAMSGSGATCFGFASAQAEAVEVARRVAHDRPDWWALATVTA